ncbi:MAG: transcriptional regulator NrdR [Actinobacteria bacterium]|nr:transcriptional regulator NrdR [Actinomycetota bacterium]MCG2819876.1 transcriptional regulator NrdR [Actinomycetes bacterium]MBU4179901.1 transcriptional regulator NrdR [Actinomycetota bacterium]MBU4219139.1 transcriptional regulator NrdR [Actinomycetota bacterium]MBU4358426.1 transcriptional regulator NrdR [Actinomycetota bacterium]
MKCPYCDNQKTKVIDSRAVEDGGVIRRRRRCEECDSRFTTFERRETVGLMVVKRDGVREAYSREKLELGFRKACSKRGVDTDEIERGIARIEEQVMKEHGKDVSASVLGDMVMEKLRELDEIAYLRFASVYKRFGDVSEFQKELGELMPEEADSPL